MSLTEALANFDRLPDDAIVPDRVAAEILGISIWTLAATTQCRRARFLSVAMAAASAISALKRAASNRRLPPNGNPRSRGGPGSA
jgi:hypothetical protein